MEVKNYPPPLTVEDQIKNLISIGLIFENASIARYVWIIFLRQSGYILKSGNTEIVIDPYLSDSVNRIANRPRTLPIPINPEDINFDAVIFV